MTEKAMCAAPAPADPATTGMARSSLRNWMLAAPAIVLLILFLVLPLWENALKSVRMESPSGEFIEWSLKNYVKLFTDSYYLGILFETIKVSAISTVLALLVSYPVAYFMVRRAGRWAVPLLFILVMPLLTSLIMRTFGWRVLFASNGFVSQWLMALGITSGPLDILGTQGVVYLGMVHVMAPFMVLSIIPVLRGIDTRLEESARILGAGAWRAFFSVTLPLSVEGIITGCVLNFMLATGSFMTMLLLGEGSVTTLPLLIFQQFTQTQDLSFAAAMGNVLLIIVLVCLYVQAQLGSRIARSRA
jgi:putative spermidine/putrescine transport system permease protein